MYYNHRGLSFTGVYECINRRLPGCRPVLATFWEGADGKIGNSLFFDNEL